MEEKHTSQGSGFCGIVNQSIVFTIQYFCLYIALNLWNNRLAFVSYAAIWGSGTKLDLSLSLSVFFMAVPHSVVVHRPQPVARPARTKRGRPERDGQFHVLGQGHEHQRGRGAERVPEAPRPAHHHQGQTAGDAQSGVRGHAETNTPHPRAARSGDRPQHASHPGDLS